jgi:hypothetical protein
MQRQRLRVGPILLLAVCSSLAVPANAAVGVPKSELWQMWAASNEESTERVDHRSWQLLLNQRLDSNHPSGISRFDYAAMGPVEQKTLQEYLASLATADPRLLSRAEQRAYWINLYNALTVQLVVENYPVKSIRKINGGLFNLGPWNEEVITIQGERIKLNDIEHRILRPIWQDARVHYALNCASLGCPNLAAGAYTAANTEELLDAGARAYINHPRGASFDGNKLQLSKIYNWFAEDFGADQTELLDHVSRYAEPALAERLQAYDGRIRYGYNWDLNEP